MDQYKYQRSVINRRFSFETEFNSLFSIEKRKIPNVFDWTRLIIVFRYQRFIVVHAYELNSFLNPTQDSGPSSISGLTWLLFQLAYTPFDNTTQHRIRVYPLGISFWKRKSNKYFSTFETNAVVFFFFFQSTLVNSHRRRYHRSDRDSDFFLITHRLRVTAFLTFWPE